MTTDNGRAFNEWLRAQLKAKKMSQRQLAQQSGVDHSTISRLIRGDRMPSLGTATKLARGLREIRDDADTSAALSVVSVGTAEPDGPRRIRAACRRGPHGAAGPPDHGVLPRRPGPPLRADVLERRCRRTRQQQRQRHDGLRRRARYGRPAGMAGGVERPTVLRTAPPQRYAAPRPAVRPARTPGRP